MGAKQSQPKQAEPNDKDLSYTVTLQIDSMNRLLAQDEVDDEVWYYHSNNYYNVVTVRTQLTHGTIMVRELKEVAIGALAISF